MKRPNRGLDGAIAETTKTNIAGKATTTFIERYLPRPLTAEEVAAITSGTRKIYVFGTVKYLDAFGEIQTDSFCLEYYGLGTDSRVGHVIPGIAAQPCKN